MCVLIILQIQTQQLKQLAVFLTCDRGQDVIGSAMGLLKFEVVDMGKGVSKEV